MELQRPCAGNGEAGAQRLPLAVYEDKHIWIEGKWVRRWRGTNFGVVESGVLHVLYCHFHSEPWQVEQSPGTHEQTGTRPQLGFPAALQEEWSECVNHLWLACTHPRPSDVSQPRIQDKVSQNDSNAKQLRI